MRAIVLSITLLVSLLVAGCGGGTPKNYTVDVNAYACSGCKTKFYTTGGVYAQQCPQCKAASIEEVATYVCPSDKEKTISVRTREGTKCQKCGTLVQISEYPNEADLKNWGATKKSKSEVGGS